eukprot:10250042-Heterocapsa_arctica.AAC.1
MSVEVNEEPPATTKKPKKPKNRKEFAATWLSPVPRTQGLRVPPLAPACSLAAPQPPDKTLRKWPRETKTTINE